MKRSLPFVLALLFLLSSTIPVCASSIDHIVANSISSSIDRVALDFLDDYIYAVYMYQDSDYRDHAITSAPLRSLSERILINNSQITVSSLVDNINYVDSKVAYWQYARRAFGNYRENFTVEYVIENRQVSSDFASITVTAKMEFNYSDLDVDSYQEDIYCIDLVKIGNAWFVADITEMYSWFDDTYKHNPNMDIRSLMDDVDALVAAEASTPSVAATDSSDSRILPYSVPYNHSYAAAYALTYTSSYSSSISFYNENFSYYDGVDCMNFASQCIWAGFGGNNTYYSVNNKAFPMDSSGTNQWYGSTRSNVGSSYSWTSCSYFRSYADASNAISSETRMQTSYYYIPPNSDFSSIANYSSELQGAVVFGNTYGHAVIISDVYGASRSSVLYCAHTNMAQRLKISDIWSTCQLKVYIPQYMLYSGSEAPATFNVQMYAPVRVGTQLTLTAEASTTYTHLVQTITTPSGNRIQQSVSAGNYLSQQYTFLEQGLYTISVFGTDAMYNVIDEFVYTIRTYN